MKLQHAAVIGHPIGHTMSPFIHKRLFALEGRSVSYQVLDVPELSASLPALRSLDCFNVTIPHKGAIIPFLDELEENARRFGSVNTVKVEAGRMKGYTTDGAGCYKALENHGVDCSGRVLLLGNGGAARAMAFEAAVRQRDLDLTVACRESSQPKAVALAQEVAAFLRERGDRAFRLSIKTYEELEEGSDEPYFTTSGNAVYRYIAGINNPDRVNWTEVTRTSKVTVTFSAYVFTFANIVTPATSSTNLTMPYYSNDPVLIAAMEDPENGPGLTPGAWSSEPLEIDMRGSGIIKGLYDALLGCREGDYVESYMTYNMAYGDINFSTIPKESPVAYFLR